MAATTILEECHPIGLNIKGWEHLQQMKNIYIIYCIYIMYICMVCGLQNFTVLFQMFNLKKGKPQIDNKR